MYVSWPGCYVTIRMDNGNLYVKEHLLQYDVLPVIS